MVTIQVAADGDTFNAISSKTSNYSLYTQIHAAQAILPYNKRNAFLSLDIIPFIPTGSTINYCRYYFKTSTAPGLTTMNFYDVTELGMECAQLTWDNYKTGSAWAAAGGDFGSVRGTKSFTPIIGTWYYVDLTTWTQNRFDSAALLLLGITNTIGQLLWHSNEAATPADRPYFEISYTPPSTAFSALGKFRLGFTSLGSAPNQSKAFETLTITDTEALTIAVLEDETIVFLENINGTTYLYCDETITITEAQSYLSDYLAGVKGTITTLLDVTSADYCQTIIETGQLMMLNGVAERAHIFTKQTSQKFDVDVKILPGDAAMFTCPDLVVTVGDTVIWDGKTFEVADSINHYFANTIIYVKHALQRQRYTQSVPQVLALVASENLKGKTTLTWDDVDFPTFDHYEIWESVVGGAGTAVAIATVSDTGPGTILIQTGEVYAAGKYLAGGKITIQGSDENDGDYALTAYQDNGGYDELVLTLTEAWDITGALGYITNATHFYKIDTAKSNTLTVKNLVENSIYYYLVRAVDSYGNPGRWSNQAATPVNTTKPTQPEGLR